MAICIPETHIFFIYERQELLQKRNIRTFLKYYNLLIPENKLSPLSPNPLNGAPRCEYRRCLTTGPITLSDEPKYLQ